MVVRKCISMSESDRDFCFQRHLSPSKLFKERVEQIREDASGSIKSELKKIRRELENTERKNSHLSSIIEKIGNSISLKFGDEAFKEIFSNI